MINENGESGDEKNSSKKDTNSSSIMKEIIMDTLDRIEFNEFETIEEVKVDDAFQIIEKPSVNTSVKFSEKESCSKENEKVTTTE